VRLFDMRILTFDDAEPLRFLTQGNRPCWSTRCEMAHRRRARVRQKRGRRRVRAQTRIKQTVAGSLRDEFGLRTVHDVVSGERDHIMNSVREKVDQDLKRIGVVIIDVRLKRVDLPQDVSESVTAGMEAGASASPTSCARPASPRRAHPRRRRSPARGDSRGGLPRRRSACAAKATQGGQYLRAGFSQNPEFFSFYRSWKPTARPSAAGTTDAARAELRLLPLTSRTPSAASPAKMSDGHHLSPGARADAHPGSVLPFIAPNLWRETSAASRR